MRSDSLSVYRLPIKFLMFLLPIPSLSVCLALVRTEQSANEQPNRSAKQFRNKQVHRRFVYFIFFNFARHVSKSYSQQEVKLLFSFHLISIQYKEKLRAMWEFSSRFLLLMMKMEKNWIGYARTTAALSSTSHGKYLYADYITQLFCFSTPLSLAVRNKIFKLNFVCVCNVHTLKEFLHSSF